MYFIVTSMSVTGDGQSPCYLNTLFIHHRIFLHSYTPRLGAHKVHTQATNWNSARKICMTEGGHLAIINSRAESELIAGLVANSGTHVGSVDSNYVHIGFHDLYSEGEFVTVNGEPLEIVGFSDWHGGGPNNDGNEDCGSIYRNGKLNDIGCEKSVGFVCELPQN